MVLYMRRWSFMRNKNWPLRWEKVPVEGCFRMQKEGRGFGYLPEDDPLSSSDKLNYKDYNFVLVCAPIF